MGEVNAMVARVATRETLADQTSSAHAPCPPPLAVEVSQSRSSEGCYNQHPHAYKNDFQPVILIHLQFGVTTAPIPARSTNGVNKLESPEVRLFSFVKLVDYSSSLSLLRSLYGCRNWRLLVGELRMKCGGHGGGGLEGIGMD